MSTNEQPSPDPVEHHPRQLTRRVDSTGGATLALHDLGGTGAPLLLAHATGFHGLVWAPLVSHLHGYHAWAPDLRGHGDSVAPAGSDFAWSDFADDVLAVVDELELQRPVAVGHSKGGAALLLAEERRPGTFKALYLYEPVVMPPQSIPFSPEDNPLAVGALRRKADFESFDAAFANYSAKPPLSSLDPAARRAYVDGGFRLLADGSVTLKCRPENEAQMYRMGSTHDAFSHLERVTCPVVVARGGLGDFGPAAFADQIVDALPHGRLELFEHLGHFGPLEEPATIAAAIERSFATA